MKINKSLVTFQSIYQDNVHMSYWHLSLVTYYLNDPYKRIDHYQDINHQDH